jgi:hypothetical protein
MQVGARSLLAASFVAWVAACSFNEHGLGSTSGAQATGAAGAPLGTTGSAGAGGMIAGPTGGGGATSLGGTSGAGNATGGAAGGGGAPATGAAGDNSGTAGDNSGTAGAGSGAAGDSSGTAGASSKGGAGGATAGAGGGSTIAGDAGAGATGGMSGAGGSTASDPGCSDGTREGFLDATTYPTIAACAGAWDTPGLDSTDALTPQCNRRAGNDGDIPDGRGCSAADLCESGWHVCATAHGVAVATNGAGCTDAVAPANGKPVFYVTRQRATGLTCDTGPNPTGTNNLYGCGNIGSTADKNSCSPLNRMMRDSDCLLNSPWMCSDGPNGTSQDEYDVVTKGGSSRGGVLCCHD